MFGKPTGDNLANLFAVVSGGMLADANEAAKNEMFLLSSWLDCPRLIVDFAVTEIVSCQLSLLVCLAACWKGCPCCNQHTFCCQIWPLLQA